MRIDLGKKLLDVKYFRDVGNFNQNNIIGINKVLAPCAINNDIGNSELDGEQEPLTHAKYNLLKPHDNAVETLKYFD